MNGTLPASGRLAGIDYGTVRIGVAVTDPQRCLASPLTIYARGRQEQDAEYFQGLVRAEDIVGFVVGLPVHGSGAESQQSREARDFGRWLAEVTGCPVTFYDERYTSRQADQLLAAGQMTRKRRVRRRDMLAAQIMLAGYLESRQQHNEPGALDD